MVCVHTQRIFVVVQQGVQFQPSKQTTVYVLSRYTVAKVFTCHILPESM